MAIFEEQEPKTRTTLLFLLAVFAFSYPLWHLGDREMFWNEGEYAAAAQEAEHFPPLMTNHGQIEPNIYPLYPMIARGISKCGFSMEFSLRAVSALSLFFLTLILWFASYRAGGHKAAAAAATVMLTTLLSAEKSVEGYPQMLTVLILYGGWLTWFELALVRNSWNLAWLSAGLFASLAYYNTGLPGIVFFVLPLLMQQRPLNVWTKLRYPGLPAGAFLVFLTVLLHMAPQWNTPASAQVLPDFTGLPEHILMFPLDFLFRFLPWSLMLWAPFCAALIPLDPNPLYGKFHRILFYTVAVLLWINPGTRGRDLLYLAPLVAAMVGVNYWIVVRRYGWKILSLFRFFGWGLLILAALGLFFLFSPDALLGKFLPMLHSLEYRAEPGKLMVCFGEIALAVISISVGLYRSRHRPKVWEVYALLFAGMMLLFWSIVNPYRAADRSKSTFGQEWRNALLADAQFKNLPEKVVYKDAAISGLYSEGCYLGFPVRTHEMTTEFPGGPEYVYVISTGVPSSPERGWTRLHDSEYKDKRLYLYKGQLRKDEYENFGEH